MSSKPPSRSVFVGNIPYNLPEQEIKDLFSGCGEVLSFRLVIDKETGRGKGFGFVEFPNIESAETAVRNLNNYDIQGRKLRVDFSNDTGGDDDNAGSNAYHHQHAHSNGVNNTSTAQSELPPLPAGVDLPPGVTCPNAISRTLATLPPQQTLDVLSQMKTLATTNPAQATELLQQAPQLSYAIFQALLLMGLVSPEALAGVVEAAATGTAAPTAAFAPPPGTYPPGFPPPPPHMSGMLGMPIGTPPVQAASPYPPPMGQSRGPPAHVAAPAQTNNEHELLLQQVLEMPQQLIDQLPPADRAQVMQLRAAYCR